MASEQGHDVGLHPAEIAAALPGKLGHGLGNRLPLLVQLLVHRGSGTLLAFAHALPAGRFEGR